MKVEDLLGAVKDSRVNNREKALLIARMQRTRAKRNNPGNDEIPSGWNAGPFSGGSNPHET